MEVYCFLYAPQKIWQVIIITNLYQFNIIIMPIVEEAVPNTILGRQKFEERTRFMGERINTCRYRFFKILQNRRTEVPRLRENLGNPQLQEQIREKILSSVDEYVHCLRAHHQGGEMPEYLLDSVNYFKDKAYTQLAPQFVLEEAQWDLTRKIFDHNYKA